MSFALYVFRTLLPDPKAIRCLIHGHLWRCDSNGGHACDNCGRSVPPTLQPTSGGKR